MPVLLVLASCNYEYCLMKSLHSDGQWEHQIGLALLGHLDAPTESLNLSKLYLNARTWSTTVDILCMNRGLKLRSVHQNRPRGQEVSNETKINNKLKITLQF